MENTEKIIQEILATNTPRNSVDAVLTFSLAAELFSKTYAVLSTEELNYLKLNPDFVVCACNLVENLYDKRHKGNKKELAIRILAQCLKIKNLGYHGDEPKFLDALIESLHSNGRIKKISLVKKASGKLGNFFSLFLK
jgi:hypothetical protein